MIVKVIVKMILVVEIVMVISVNIMKSRDSGRVWMVSGTDLCLPNAHYDDDDDVDDDDDSGLFIELRVICDYIAF